MSYQLILARTLQRLGILRALELWRSKPGILIVNHHRIGTPDETGFDRDLFSATADELDAQVQYFKQRAPIISGEELEDLVSGRTPLKRLYVAFTFDDGYLDNYTKAFDVFRSAGTTAAFFLVTDYVGTATVPWWDEIAYRVRNTRRTEINLEYPTPLKVPLNGHREASIATVLQHYKRTDNICGEEFLAEIRRETECDLPLPKRRFLNWDEAREMRDAGMAIGSHTRSHAILGRLSPELQKQELEDSKKEIEARLGSKVRGLAYPVGARNCFSHATEQIAMDAGYSMCFSAYGGMNDATHLNRSNLLRGTVPSNPERFRAVATVRTSLGRHL
ncbi:polysaccharide deacetylase family protein [Edaphobacter paludis]|uniref:Polysaccharide deacetylase family protein n=1 Tax=Edaphobacter paludis TaxID=3035702 RepID=A0AAU7D552_9BACT